MLFVENWKTSAGLVVLGVFASYVLGAALPYAFSAVSGQITGIVIIALACCLAVFSIVYSLAIYPSLFTEKPRLKSPATASFLNGFAGGVVFGPLWCASLTRKRIGISQYVLASIEAVGLVVAIALAIFASYGEFDGFPQGQSEWPMSKQELIQEAALEDGITHQTRVILTREMAYLDEGGYSDNLERIQFGTLWNSQATGQGWFVEGTDFDTAMQLLAIAIRQMADSDEEYNKAIDALVSASPVEDRNWDGKNPPTWYVMQTNPGYVYVPEEPSDKSLVRIREAYPDITFRADGRVWHVGVVYYFKGDGSQMPNGYAEDAKVEIVSLNEDLENRRKDSEGASSRSLADINYNVRWYYG